MCHVDGTGASQEAAEGRRAGQGNPIPSSHIWTTSNLRLLMLSPRLEGPRVRDLCPGSLRCSFKCFRQTLPHQQVSPLGLARRGDPSKLQCLPGAMSCLGTSLGQPGWGGPKGTGSSLSLVSGAWHELRRVRGIQPLLGVGAAVGEPWVFWKNG